MVRFQDVVQTGGCVGDFSRGGAEGAKLGTKRTKNRRHRKSSENGPWGPDFAQGFVLASYGPSREGRCPQRPLVLATGFCRWHQKMPKKGSVHSMELFPRGTRFIFSCAAKKSVTYNLTSGFQDPSGVILAPKSRQRFLLKRAEEPVRCRWTRRLVKKTWD